jgi:hypothetical protein
MLYNSDAFSLDRINMRWIFYIAVLAVATILSGCHLPQIPSPIKINPSSTPQRIEDHLYSTKVAGYVMTDADRAKQVTTEAGGGGKVSYFPYSDLEQGIRDALKSLYHDIVLVGSPSDFEALKRDGVGIIFAPEIYTASNSSATFSFPPTHFSIDLACTVTDTTGYILARVRVTGEGNASSSELNSDISLAGKRAAQDALNKFTSEIRANPRLR